MSPRSPRYQNLGPGPAGTGADEAWLSPEILDPDWDAFLQRVPCGHFQQSSCWAAYKAVEGWRHHRVVLTGATGVTGGFQILWKKSGLARIGYVSKGPVLELETPAAVAAITGRLDAAIRELSLHALILQAPDDSTEISPLLVRRGYQPNRIKNVIRSTLLVNLSGGMAGVAKAMNATARWEVKQAQRRGTVIREGGPGDLGHFFALMAETCRRQETAPNPASEAELRCLWDSLQPLGIKLMLAQCHGEDVAGQLCIPFGSRVTIWKKGWNGRHRECHPNRLLNHAGLEWAAGCGGKYWDYVGLDEDIASALLAGRPLSAEQKKSRDMFHLGFGGEPRLLPASLIWIRNPLLRLGYGGMVKFLRR